MHPIFCVESFMVVIPTAKEAHFNVRAADTKGFLAIHGVPDGSASVFLGPDTRQSARILEANVQCAKRQNSGHALIDCPIDLGVTTVEVLMTVGAAGVVRVGTAGHAELVWIVAAHILHGYSVFQRLPAIAALDVIDTSYVRSEEHTSE